MRDMTGRQERSGDPVPGLAPPTTVRFTGDDLARVHLAAAPAPLVESALGFAELRHQLNSSNTSNWAIQARQALPLAARPLLDLIPASGPWPEFLDPAIGDLDEALEIVNGTPRWRLRQQLAISWRRAGRPPTWLRALADGDREALTAVVQALRAFYLGCVAPSWPVIEASFRDDVATRAAVLARGGLGELFGTLHQDLTLRAGTLERARRSLSRAGRPGEHRLDGQGLQILPSMLWTGPPLFSICPPGPARSTMIYSARPAFAAASAGESPDLAALMGRTRAAVLRALRDPCSTAELAARLGISAASASEHAASLRGADLIQTERRGRRVRHSLTPLGHSLLNGHRDNQAPDQHEVPRA